MKFLLLPLVLAACLASAHAERLIPSSVDPASAAAREKAFIPWSTPEESSAFWKKLSPNHVPVYYERKDGPLSRDIYIPNPGIGYWVLGGLTEKQLFKIHREKLEIDDTLISASAYPDERGNRLYWALWAPRERAYLLTDPMKKLGIGQARIEFSWADRFLLWAAEMKPFSGFITAASLALNGLLFLLVGAIVLGGKASRINSSSPG
ncbi:MAG TPA: hypothetical protein VIS74_03535 [Chthoniobacterales bacterium]